MSVYINSDDVYSGTSYNGRYNLSRQLFGQYTLQDYDFNSTISNWCNSTNNQLLVTDPNNIGLPAVNVIFGNISSGATGDIISWFETAFSQLNDNGYSITFNTTYNASLDRYTTTFARELAVSYYGPGESTGPDMESTIAPLFDWTPNGDGVLFTQPFTEFVISGKNFGIPHFLEVICPQMRSRLYTSTATNPSFIISTSDHKVTGQSISIPIPTNYLDLQITKAGYENTTYTLINNFSLIFKPI
jgi:hypothetical protein